MEPLTISSGFSPVEITRMKGEDLIFDEVGAVSIPNSNFLFAGTNKRDVWKSSFEQTQNWRKTRNENNATTWKIKYIYRTIFS